MSMERSMEYRTKRIIAHTAKNLLGLCGFVAMVAAYIIAMMLLKVYVGLTDTGLFMFGMVPVLLGGAVWLCWLKARDDVTTLEHREEMTMARLKQEYIP